MVRLLQGAECAPLTFCLRRRVPNSKPAGHENKVLDVVIAPNNTRTLRDFLLGQLEIFLVNSASKKSLEDNLQEYARNLGANSIIPTTIKQFKKLTSFLDGEVQFYAACCAPCNRTDTTCTHCGQAVWIGKRPRHVFFVRSVKKWLEDLLRVPTVRDAIEQFRKRKPEEGVIGDVLDGEVAQELVLKGVPIVLYAETHPTCRLAPSAEGLLLPRQLGWLPPVQKSFIKDDGRIDALTTHATARAAHASRVTIHLVGCEWSPLRSEPLPARRPCQLSRKHQRLPCTRQYACLFGDI